MKVDFHLNVIHLPQKIRLQIFVPIMKILSTLLILLFPLISLAEIEFIESYKKAIDSLEGWIEVGGLVDGSHPLFDAGCK